MTTTTVADATAAARRAVEDVIAGRALRAFYAAVLAVALVGSAIAAENWLGWWLPAAFGAVALYELGGVALSIFADRRRQKGERAFAARLLSAAFAAGAVAVQLFGHTDANGTLTGPGYFFAGFSAAAYAIYLLDSSARRRDVLREAGKLAETPPAYGAYQWFRHPWLTRRARALAVGNAEVRLVERITSREAGGADRATTPLLGRSASLAAAADQVRRERRTAAISGALRARIAAGVDPTMATIAVNTFDIDRVAQGLADGADYPALTGLLGAELTPARIAAGITARQTRRSWLRRRPETVETAPETDPLVAAMRAAAAVPAWPGAAPDDTQELPIIAAAAPAPEPTRAPAAPAPRAPETVETDLVVDLVDQAPALPPVEAAVLPHLARVMGAHRDWAVSIGMPSRHPDALTYAKIKAAAGISGQQTAADIRTALLMLCHYPEAAQAYVDAKTPSTAAV